jgi:hypothetical protein
MWSVSYARKSPDKASTEYFRLGTAMTRLIKILLGPEQRHVRTDNCLSWGDK